MKTVELLPKLKLYRFDPVACFLLEKIRFSPPIFGLSVIPIGTGIYLTTAWLSDTLWSKPGQMGLLQDWFPWIWVLFIVPVVLGYYLWSFEAIDKLIRDLVASEVLDINESEVEEFKQIAFSAYKPKWRKLLALSSAVVFSIFVCVTRFGLKNSWTGSHPIPIAMITVATFVVVYMGSILVLNLIMNIWILHCTLKRELDRREFNVNPLHPDRCGGLRSLSNYALKTAYLAAVLGIMVGFIEYQFLLRGTGQNYWFIHLIIPLDILLSVACFFGPLLAAHRGMRRAKEELLREIAKQFQTDYSQIHSGLAGDAETLKKGSEKIKELRSFYTLTDEFPIWPFDVQTFRRFLLTVPAPILPLIIGILKKMIETLLKRWGIELG